MNKAQHQDPTEPRIVLATLRNPVTGAVDALINPQADWSPVDVGAAADDIVTGRHRYVVGAVGDTVELRVVRTKSRTYLRSASDSTAENNLRGLPQYLPDKTKPVPANPASFSIGRLSTKNLPRWLTPVTLNVADLPLSDRRAVKLGILTLVIVSMLLIRPPSWGAWGGMEYVPQIIRYPRIALLAVAVCLAASGGVLAWGLAGNKQLWALALVPLGLLSAASSARITGPIADVLRARGSVGFTSLPTEVQDYFWGLILLSLGGMALGLIAALLGIIYAFIDQKIRVGRVRLFPAVAISGSLVAPILAYAAAYLPRGSMGRSLTVVDSGAAAIVPMTFSQSMALELLLMAVALQYAVVVVTYWQASATAHLFGEVGSVAGNQFSWRGRLLIPLLILGCVKLTYCVYGYANRLPDLLGGSAEYWYNAGVPPIRSALWAAAILLPLAWISVRKLQRGIADGMDVLKQGLAASLGVALVASYPQATESATLVLDQIFRSLRGIDFASPLYIANPSQAGTWAAGVMSIIGAIVLWRRKPGSAAVLAMAAGALVLNALHWAVGALPFVGLATIDLVVSFGFAVAVAVALFSRREVPSWAIAVWGSLTVLTHGSAIFPGGLQARTFEFILVLTLAYTFLFRAAEVNAFVHTNPSQVVTIVGFTAMVALVNLVGVRAGDRYGREDNPAVGLWLITGDAAGLVVAPFLVLVVFVACSRASSGRTTMPAAGQTHG